MSTQNRWNVLRLSGLGFIMGFSIFLVRALVHEAGTALTPGALLSLVFYGGLGGAILLAVAAIVRNFIVNRSRT